MRLFRNTLVSSADTIILIALSLVATPVFISHFGTAGYGVFIFLNIFSVYGALSFFDLGMEGALMTHVARFEVEGAHDKVRDALSIAVLYYGAVGVVIAAGLCGVAGWLAGRFDPTEVEGAEVLSAVYLVAINALLQFLSMPFVAVLQGLHRFMLTKGISSLLNITQYLVLIVIAVWTHRIDAAFFGITVLSALRLTAYVIAYLRMPQFGLRAGCNWPLFRVLWGTSSMLFLNRLIGLVYNQVSKFFIWWRLPIVNMAVYDVVNRPAALVRVLAGMVYSAIIPEVARLKHQNDTALIKSLYLRLVRYSYLLIMPPIVAISVHASQLLGVWVGPEFTQYGPMVWVLMLVALINPVASVASTVVVGLDMVKQTVWISVMGTLINVAVGAILIGTMGVMGLLIGVLAAEALMAVPYFVVMNRILHIRTMEVIAPLARITVAAVGFSALHYPLPMRGFETTGFITVVGVLVLAHYGFQFLLLLDSSERRFLLERLRVIKTSRESA